MKMPAKVVYHTLKHWDTPRDGMFNIITDSWWLVDGEGRPLFYSKNNYPQCNKNKEIAGRFAGGYQVNRIPVAYVPLLIQDYIQQ